MNSAMVLAIDRLEGNQHVAITAVDIRGKRITRMARGLIFGLPIWDTEGARTFVHDVYCSEVSAPPDRGYLEITAI